MFEGMDRETLGVDADEVWEFCMKCSQLTSLSLILFPNNRDGSESQMLTVLDDTERKADLKRLDLQVEEFQIDWPSMKKWIGKGLEEIRLVEPQARKNGFECLIFPSSDVYGIFKDYGSTLKSIKLDGVALEEKGISFPNLTTLSITESASSTIKFFTDSIAPNLKYLSLNQCHDSTDLRRELPLQVAFDCLHNLLKKLISLSVIRILNPHQGLALDSLLTLTGLKSLEIRGNSDKLQKWFSKHEYPNLILFEIDDDDLRPESLKERSKLLQK